MAKDPICGIVIPSGPHVGQQYPAVEARLLLDLLDDLGELVAKMGGRVLVIPAEQMPGRTGLAATYRY